MKECQRAKFQKNRPPKGGRVCSLRSQGAQDCPWLRLGTLVNPAHSCSRQHTSEHFRPPRNTLDPMTTRMLLRRGPHRSSHRKPRTATSLMPPSSQGISMLTIIPFHIPEWVSQGTTATSSLTSTCRTDITAHSMKMTR